jgi:shikimate kinase
MPFSGKTTIGQMLAEQLQYEFIDTDRLIEIGYWQKTGQKKSCREIYLIEGSAYFRMLEKQQIAELHRDTKFVMAIGGGAFEDPDNRSNLQTLGHIVYLKAAIPQIWLRMQKQGIPAYLDPNDPQKDLVQLTEKRMPFYRTSATSTIETDDLKPEEIVFKIITNILPDDKRLIDGK